MADGIFAVVILKEYRPSDFFAGKAVRREIKRFLPAFLSSRLNLLGAREALVVHFSRIPGKLVEIGPYFQADRNENFKTRNGKSLQLSLIFASSNF